MIFNRVHSDARVWISALLGTAMLVSCNAVSWSDPFASPPIGQKFFVPANPDNAFPVPKSESAGSARAVVINLTNGSAITSSRIPLASVGDRKPIGFKMITFYGRDGVNTNYSRDQIEQANQSDSCRAIQSDIRDLLAMYPSMTLVCSENFAAAFSGAGAIGVVTDDGLDHQFTSWGTHWSDVGTNKILVYSLSL